MDTTDSERLTRQAAAKFLGLRPQTLGRLILRRQVPFIRISPRVVVFERRALQRFLDERRVEPAPG